MISVWRDGLRHEMKQYGVEDKFVRVCERLYNRMEEKCPREVN